MKISLFWLALSLTAIPSRAEISWSNSQFGSPNLPGGAEWLQDGSLKIIGSGNTQSNGALALHHVFYKPSTNGSITTCVQLRAATAIGGVLIRFLEDDFLFVGTYGDGTIKISGFADTKTSEWRINPVSSLWLKVAWSGGTGTAAISHDGNSWQEIHVFDCASSVSSVGVGTSSTDGRPAVVLFSGLAPVNAEGEVLSVPVPGHKRDAQERSKESKAPVVASSSGRELNINRLKAADLPYLRYMHFAHLLPDKTGVLRFVDPIAGDDRWNGQCVERATESPNGPWKTLLGAANSAGDGDVIVLKAGTHYTTGFASPPGKTIIITSTIGAIMTGSK